MKQLSTLLDVTRYFADEDRCRKHLEQMRWGGKIACPHCGACERIYRFKDGKLFKCGECRRKFTVTVGTVFQDSKIPLSKWFVAIYIMTSHKKGISSLQLAKDLGVKKSTAWFMLHRIREMVRDKYPERFSGICEMDEVYLGGKIENWHKDKRAALGKNRHSSKHKMAVIAIVQRGEKKVAIKAVESANQKEIHDLLHKNVEKGTTLHTDESRLYHRIWQSYFHHTVSHNQLEYVRDNVHTNTVEGFFAILRRSIYGIYHQVSPKHLSRYCDETKFRYEHREQSEIERMNHSLSNCEGRLKYKNLIQKNILPLNENEGQETNAPQA